MQSGTAEKTTLSSLGKGGIHGEAARRRTKCIQYKSKERRCVINYRV